MMGTGVAMAPGSIAEYDSQQTHQQSLMHTKV